jgi:phenylacetate-CoA ligase
MVHEFFYDREQETLPHHLIQTRQRERAASMFEVVLAQNSFYRKKYRDAGWQGVPDMKDWDRFPFTTKAELVADAAAYPPYGSNLTFPLEKYVRLHQTSGSTGRPLVVLDTMESWQWWKKCWGYIFNAAGMRPGEPIYLAFSFGPFIGFWAPFDAGPELGYRVLSGGGQTSVQRLRAILEHQATVLMCTPSYAFHLEEVAKENGIDIAASSIRITIHAGEPGASIPSTKQRIADAWGAKCFDHIGASEIGAFAFECHAQPGGVHINELDYVCETINPQTLRPCQSGEIGELVMSNLGRWGFPVIRYRTGDLVRLSEPQPCVCGRSFRMLLGGILSRADDMMIVRGVNVYPSAIESVVRSFPQVLEFEGTVTARHGMDDLTLRVEINSETASETQNCLSKIREELRNRLSLRIEVEAVPVGSLPRYELKSKRFKRQARS